LTSHCIEITPDLLRRNVVLILFEDSRLLKAQLFLVPHDKVSGPKSANIGIFNSEEISHVRNCDRNFVVFAGAVLWSKLDDTGHSDPKLKTCGPIPILTTHDLISPAINIGVSTNREHTA
jgi:hypothetical protein